MRIYIITLLVVVTLLFLSPVYCNDVLKITDLKTYKKFLKSRNNILIVYSRENKALTPTIQTLLKDTAKSISGIGAIATLDCEGIGNNKNIKDIKKICKNIDFDQHGDNKGLLWQHYTKGKEDIVYNRALNIKQLTNFMQDPNGEISWEDDEKAKYVQHLNDENFDKIINKKLPTLVMFYAPWCGHCKALKPAWAEAAERLKKDKFKGIIAAIDANSSNGKKIGKKYDISGYPTLKYFDKGQYKYEYAGGRDTDSIVKWMKSPEAPPPPPPPEVKWSDTPGTNVTHLTDQNFKEVINQDIDTLVMFYAPWCGHCKAAKPGYDAAAGTLKSEGNKGIVAAIDATIHTKTANAYPDVTGYPTFIHFRNGKKVKIYEGGRDYKGFLSFMRSPNDASKNSPMKTADPEEEQQQQAEEIDPDSKVIQLTKDTYYQQLSSASNALIMYFAPWCGHCKAFKPHLKTAANELSQVLPKASLYQIDCTRHGDICNKENVKGYPTIKYFEHGVFKEEYNGGRDVAGVKKYMFAKVGKQEL